MSHERLARELRALYPRVLGKTLALTGRLADAEDAVQEAVVRALATWPRTGAPDSEEAWLLTVASNCHRDRLRRGRRAERAGDALAHLAGMSPWVQGAVGALEVARGWKDDLLRLLFVCCHPCLEVGESAALALATVLGMSNGEIARAFGVAPRSLDQRLTRARRRLRERGDVEAPRVGDDARGRLEPVLAVVYLLFNEGYWSTHDDEPIRGDLCRLALGLGRSLREAFPAETEVAGLLALMLLHDGRRRARIGPTGTPIPLPEQDRTLWDREAIAEGVATLGVALRDGAPGPYQIEAAISATHCQAARAEATDWRAIAELYALLERARPTAAVRVNRAFAVARAHGPGAGLAMLDGAPRATDGSPHLVRGALLAELGRIDEAASALRRAATLARNAHERRQIEERIESLQKRRGS